MIMWANVEINAYLDIWKTKEKCFPKSHITIAPNKAIDGTTALPMPKPSSNSHTLSSWRRIQSSIMAHSSLLIPWRHLTLTMTELRQLFFFFGQRVAATHTCILWSWKDFYIKKYIFSIYPSKHLLLHQLTRSWHIRRY